MKAIVLACCALSATAGLAAPGRPSDRERTGLNGPVRKVRVEIAHGQMSPAGAFVETRREPFEEVSYDSTGDIVSQRFYDGGAPIVTETWKTQPDGSRVIESNAALDGGTGFRLTRLRPQPQVGAPLVKAADGMYTFVRAYGYDANGRVINETIYSGAVIAQPMAFAVSRYVYNQAGQLAEIQRTAAQTNRLLERVAYTYNRQKLIEQEYVYGPENLLLRRFAYSYELDDHGNWTRRTGIQLDDPNGRAEVLVRTITYDDAK